MSITSSSSSVPASLKSFSSSSSTFWVCCLWHSVFGHMQYMVHDRPSVWQLHDSGLTTTLQNINEIWRTNIPSCNCWTWKAIFNASAKLCYIGCFFRWSRLISCLPQHYLPVCSQYMQHHVWQVRSLLWGSFCS